METLLLYILKSSGLMASFYLLYHLLLRRETFFTLSRWYLLGGLAASLTLPLLEIRKVVMVPRPALTVDDLLAMAQPQEMQFAQEVVQPVAQQLNWFEIGFYGYLAVALIMLSIVLLNLVSLWRLLYRQEIVKREKFALVDLDKDVAPFSFFRYIVFNSRLYSSSELDSILNHEKVHSEQHHTLDVLFARLVCIVFWFNPFVWLFRKAIAQNLEYIADQQAVRRSNDRKAYQIALLKVGASPTTISITNPFYQSLIKKRIVMLNKEQSKKSHVLKYALVLPLIMAFMLNFQVKVVAQAPEAPAAPEAAAHPEAPAAPAPPTNGAAKKVTRIVNLKDGSPVVIDKTTSDAQLKSKAAQLKGEGITLKVSKVKRNKKGEITGIKLEYTDKDGNKSVSQVKGSEPIKPIYFMAKDGNVSYSTSGNNFAGDALNDFSFNFDDIDFAGAFNFNFDDDGDIEIEIPERPDAPALPEGSPEAPAPPAVPGAPVTKNKKIIIKNGSSFITGQNPNAKPLVIINGKVMGSDFNGLSGLNPATINSVEVFKDPETILKYGSKAKDGVIIIKTDDLKGMANLEDLKGIQSSAMKIAKEALSMASKEMGGSSEDMEQAKLEMAKAKEEMLQAKKEMEAAKAEYEKAKRELKKP